MEGYRSILRRAGWMLIVTGAIDIAVMIYCVTHQRSYSSSFNIVAVIAGLFLLKGHLGAVRIVTTYVAFMLAGLGAAALLIFPFMQPLDLWKTQFHLDPAGSAASIIFAVAVPGLLYWIYRQLRSRPVIQARAGAGRFCIVFPREAYA